MRRNRLDLMIEAEIACHRAIEAVERMPADERLTNAQIKIAEGQKLIADYVDEKIGNEAACPPSTR